MSSLQQSGLSLDEFDLIENYFRQLSTADDVLLGIGDDAAVVQAPAGSQLVMTIDTLLAGVHFPEHTAAQDIACKSIAVNLSDLAAMGATPRWLMLSLSLPRVDTDWLQAFARGFAQQCERFGVSLIGGDTTCGNLAVTVQATGFVESGRGMRRDRARAGDLIMVTGTLGDAALALQQLENGNELPVELLTRLNRPEPRVEFARQLARLCDCCIDVSDGLLADLNHIVSASNCGAVVELWRIPLSPAYRQCCSADNDVDRLTKALTGGDDYELCFTVNPDKLQSVTQLAKKCRIACTVVGNITSTEGIRCINKNGQPVDIPVSGYKHFR